MDWQDPAAGAPTLLDSALLIPVSGAVGGMLLMGGCARVVNRLRARNVKVAPRHVRRRWQW